jgi:hypothetical protein
VWAQQGGVAGKDLLVEFAQLRAWIEPERVTQRGPGRLEGIERVDLPPGAVERSHRQCAERLACRRGVELIYEVVADRGVPAQREFGVPPLLEDESVPPVEPGRMHCQVLAVHSVERGAPPDVQRSTEASAGLGMLAAAGSHAGPLGRGLEHGEVERAGRSGTKQVRVAASLDGRLRQYPPQRG